MPPQPVERLRVLVLFGHFFFQAAHTRLHFKDRLEHFFQHAPYRKPRLNFRLLGEIAELDAFRYGDCAAVLVLALGENAQEGALAAAVCADKAHAAPGLQRQRRAAEHFVQPEGFSDFCRS